jgi:hypothetical protein
MNGVKVRTGPPVRPTEYRVEKADGLYEIRKDGELIGVDTQDANGTAASLAAHDQQQGRVAAHYPCFED